MADDLCCAECGGVDGVIQQVSIGWPGTRPHFLFVKELPDGTRVYEPNPEADGHYAELWLHRECEQAVITRLADRALKR
jgi:hypothetical protein